MKKAIIVLLAAILALSVVGCGCKKNNTESTDAAFAQDGQGNNAESSGTASAPSVSVGDTIKFGKYEQDNDLSNGKEDIEWIVLATEGNKALVISKYVLDSCQEYNTSYDDVTWETCSLRKWLNGTFFNTAFTAEEQNKIILTTVTADANPGYDTLPGNDTLDKVFLLSITEVNKYFSSDEARICAPTDYAIAQGAHTNNDTFTGGRDACSWWLRSPGFISTYAAEVYYDGIVSNWGTNVDQYVVAVRPAMWIDIGS